MREDLVQTVFLKLATTGASLEMRKLREQWKRPRLHPKLRGV